MGGGGHRHAPLFWFLEGGGHRHAPLFWFLEKLCTHFLLAWPAPPTPDRHHPPQFLQRDQRRSISSVGRICCFDRCQGKGRSIVAGGTVTVCRGQLLSPNKGITGRTGRGEMGRPVLPQGYFGWCWVVFHDTTSAERPRAGAVWLQPGSAEKTHCFGNSQWPLSRPKLHAPPTPPPPRPSPHLWERYRCGGEVVGGQWQWLRRLWLA